MLCLRKCSKDNPAWTLTVERHAEWRGKRVKVCRLWLVDMLSWWTRVVAQKHICSTYWIHNQMGVLQELKREYSRVSGRPHFANVPGGCIHIYLHIAEILLLRKMDFLECCMSLNNHQCHFFLLWECKRGQIPNPELNHHGPLGKPGNRKSQVLAETHPPSFNLCGEQCFDFL